LTLDFARLKNFVMHPALAGALLHAGKGFLVALKWDDG
jgi:hypothetical protein